MSIVTYQLLLPCNDKQHLFQECLHARVLLTMHYMKAKTTRTASTMLRVMMMQNCDVPPALRMISDIRFCAALSRD